MFKLDQCSWEQILIDRMSEHDQSLNLKNGFLVFKVLIFCGQVHPKTGALNSAKCSHGFFYTTWICLMLHTGLTKCFPTRFLHRHSEAKSTSSSTLPSMTSKTATESLCIKQFQSHSRFENWGPCFCSRMAMKKSGKKSLCQPSVCKGLEMAKCLKCWQFDAKCSHLVTDLAMCCDPH